MNQTNLDQTLTEKDDYFMSIKLFVRDLLPGITGDELRDLLNGLGGVESCQLMADRNTGRSKGFGVIEMNSKAAAEAVKQRFNSPRHANVHKAASSQP